MNLKITQAFIVLALIIGPTACALFQSCPEALPYFKVAGLDLTHQRFNNDPYGSPIVEGSKIPWAEYGLRTDLKSTYHALRETNGGANLYALSCVEDGYLGSQLGIDTLYFVALNDYNNTYARMDTLNNILLLNDWSVDQNFYSLAEYLAANSASIQQSAFTVKLTEAPAQDVTIEFEMVLVLSNGDEFKQKSAEVNIRAE